MRKILGIIGIALICLISFGTFFGLARGTLNDIAGFDFQTVNEANYIKVANYNDIATEDENADIKVTVDDDGIIAIKGENKSETAYEISVTTVSLEKGDYEFVSNAKGCGEKTYHIELRDSADGQIIADNEFSVEETTSYNVLIVIEAGAEIDTEFEPVVVNKGEKTSFLVNNWNPFKK